MRVISVDELSPIQWKNAGGITHEVAYADGPRGTSWRLSIADVASDGPFSGFPGLSRILTAIKGNGLSPFCPKGAADLSVHQPFHFLGDTPNQCRLESGPVQNFNVIFDAGEIEASVQTIAGPFRIESTEEDDTVCTAFCFSGCIKVNYAELKAGQLAMGSRVALRINVPIGSRLHTRHLHRRT